MWNEKKKALTFSFDDGVTQDARLIRLFNRFGLKSTFNLNSELLGLPGVLVREGRQIDHNKVRPEAVRALYAGHEIAVHTLTHPNLSQLEDTTEILRQVNEDQKNLSALAGYPVTGMAYPGGGVNYTQAVADLLRGHSAVKYARTTVATGSFTLPGDLFVLHPTTHLIRFDDAFSLAERFIALTPDSPSLFYIWGHSYEFDIHDTWDRVEEFCRLVSGRDDIFYGTNTEILFSASKE